MVGYGQVNVRAGGVPGVKVSICGIFCLTGRCSAKGNDAVAAERDIGALGGIDEALHGRALPFMRRRAFGCGVRPPCRRVGFCEQVVEVQESLSTEDD